MRNIIKGLLACTIIFSSCQHKEAVQEQAGKFTLSDSMLHMITTDTVRTCSLTDELTLSGEVSFNENNVVKVFPRSSGQVLESKVSAGDHVTRGQALATIKSADVAANYADLSSANADLAIAKRQMDNLESLYKNGISSEREYNEAKQNYEKSLAARNKIQSLININSGGKSSEGGIFTLTSPIDGYIVEKKVAAGAFIRPDMGDNLFTISDMQDVWVLANVYETDIARVKENNAVQVIPVAYPDKTFTGRIDKISQVLDPQSKAMKVRITLANPDHLLKPEMFTKIVVNSEGGGSYTCIATDAILSQDGKNYVVIYNGKTDIRISEIDIIKSVGDKTYIRSGANPGDVLVTKHQLFIFNQLSNE